MEDQVRYECAIHDWTRRTYISRNAVVTEVVDRNGELLSRTETPIRTVLVMAFLCVARGRFTLAEIEEGAKRHADSFCTEFSLPEPMRNAQQQVDRAAIPEGHEWPLGLKGRCLKCGAKLLMVESYRFVKGDNCGRELDVLVPLCRACFDVLSAGGKK